jgi:hypothetical protein
MIGTLMQIGRAISVATTVIKASKDSLRLHVHAPLRKRVAEEHEGHAPISLHPLPKRDPDVGCTDGDDEGFAIVHKRIP